MKASRFLLFLAFCLAAGCATPAPSSGIRSKGSPPADESAKTTPKVVVDARPSTEALKFADFPAQCFPEQDRLVATSGTAFVEREPANDATRARMEPELEEGCKKRDVEACVAWVEVAARGRAKELLSAGTVQDATVEARLEKACKLRPLEVCEGIAAQLADEVEVLKKHDDVSFAVRKNHHAVARPLAASCAKRNRPNCEAIGRLFFLGQVPPPEEYTKLLEKNCGKGSGTACALLAQKAAASEEPKIRKKAEGWEKKAEKSFAAGCQEGRGSDCRELAKRIGDDESKLKKAVKVMQKACKVGAPHVCAQIVKGFGTKAKLLDEAIALELFDTQCEKGNLGSCRRAVKLREAGEDKAGVAKARLTLRRHAKKRCDTGKDLEACALLAADFLDAGTAGGSARAFLERACKVDLNQCRQLGRTAIERRMDPGAASNLDEQTAQALLEVACDMKHRPACFDLAVYGRSEAHLPQLDGERAERFYKAGAELQVAECKGGDGKACLLLGRQARHGCAVERDLGKAAVRLHRACQLKVGGCQERNEVYREAALRQACARGGVGACQELATWMGGLDKRAEEPKRLRRAACERGHARACFDYAKANKNDEDTEERYRERAAELWSKACEADDVVACWTLAALGLSEAVGEALAKTLKEACSAQHALACERLAAAHQQGELGLARDSAKSASFAERAKKLREQRPSEALLAMEIKHRQQGCQGGDLDACFGLARALRLGGKSVNEEFEAWKKGCAGSCFRFEAP